MFVNERPTSDRGPVASAARRGLRWARVQMSDHPVFLPVVLRCTPRGTTRRITDATDVVIEGFPRSSNTFAAAAMHQASGGSLVVASHVHTPSQVVLAVRRSLPTLVVIREPRPTLRSLLVAAPHVRVRTAVDEWIHHYELLWPLRDRFVVATFEQVTGDFGAVIARMNARFGTSFPLFTHEPSAIEAVEQHMKGNHQRWHPGDERSAPWPILKRQNAAAWADEALSAPSHAAALQRAQELFERYRSAAV
jgi:hypothetical protein